MLDVAIEHAKSNPIRKLPKMAAVLEVSSGQYFVGFNQRKTHPLQAKFGRTEHHIHLHAEIDALRWALKAGEKVEGSSLYVARVYKNGNVGLAKPCEGCQDALMHFGIKNVEWTE